ncbi:DUF1566 domain-containing protein [bacterium]|nr:DUF1566 domain-containing protein [bacterium]
MKKLLLLLITLIFLAVSCSSSKKAENDADILPDEDEINDEDAVEPDEDEEADDEKENDEDEEEIDDGNPCNLIENSDGKYTGVSNEEFKCGCNEGYFWANPGCKKTTYANICTGQEYCCDNSGVIDCPKPGEDYYGQDPQYAALGYCTNSSFKIDKSVKNEETVKDENLKIEWMRTSTESTYTWEEAVEYCEDLEYGGHDDWRLPNPKEMLFSTLSPKMLDTDRNFWSGTPKHSDSTSAWVLYNNGEDITVRTWSKTSSLYVRCVREEAPSEPVFKVFEIAGDKIVRDMDSGLAWIEKPVKASSWKDSLAYCENLDYAGFSDWRIPNIHELISITDHRKSNPATAFPDADSSFAKDMISSTTYRYTWGDFSKSFKNISFDTGRNDRALKQEDTGFYYYALCVRNEPCREHYWWNGEKCLKDPCKNEPCRNAEHSNKMCNNINFNDYSCECDENYFWDGQKCVSPCESNPCENDKNSDKVCTAHDTEQYSCGCADSFYWNGEKCTSPCESNPCIEDKHSNGSCIVSAIDMYECGCIDGYLWNGVKCVDPCAGINCGDFEHAAGTCKPDNAVIFRCDCEEGYYWWGNKKQCLAKKPASANVCTGQNKCYDNKKEIPCPAENENFFGQDANYARLGYCIPQSFSIDNSVENEPVVVDNNTGNIWQRNIPPLETLYSEDVSKYCEDLNYGGYDDWTLPSVEDFMTIADYGRYNPAIKTEYFPDYKNFWTSSGSSSGSGGGIDNHGYYSVYGYTAIFDFTEPSTSYVQTYYYDNYSTGVDTYYAYAFNIRCLRRNSVTIPPRYFTSKTFGSSVTWNNYNDLIFAEKTGNELSWSEAMKYCSELDYAGISDWRLPNVKELFFNSKRGFHSSTTALSDINYDYSSKTEGYVVYQHSKESRLTGTFCVANDPCENGLFWNGEKCAKNPCVKDPCKYDTNSDRICTVLDEENYSCNCNKNYKWSPEKLQCVRTCQDNPCSSYSNSDKQCYDDDVEGFYCGCNEPYFWNVNSRKCTRNCAEDICIDETNSDGMCYNDETEGYVCGCIDGYAWVPGSSCRVDNCTPNPCENLENSDGTCTVTYSSYRCGCNEDYTWNSLELACVDADGWVE